MYSRYRSMRTVRGIDRICVLMFKNHIEKMVFCSHVENIQNSRMC